MEERKCLHCKKITYDEDTLRCIYCGEMLPTSIKGLTGRLSSGNGKIIVLIIAMFVLLSWFLLSIF